MDFSYTEEEKILADTVRRFAKNEIIHQRLFSFAQVISHLNRSHVCVL